MALDFDGTLAPISPHPDGARPLPETLRVLKRLRATGATVAVITGRTVSSLLHVSGFGTVPGIVVYGTHGAERWRDGELRTATAPAGMAALRQRLPGLLARLARDPAIWIEDKGLSLVIHARLTADPDRALTLLRDPVTEAAADAGLETRPGKEVLEICIPGIDKGTAIRELLGSAPAAAFYAGDDTGDLPALRELNDWTRRTGRPTVTVAITPCGDSPVAGYADITVPDPEDLLPLLRQIT